MVIYFRGSKEILDVLLEMLRSDTDNTNVWNTPDKYAPFKVETFFTCKVCDTWFDLYFSQSRCLNLFNQHIHSTSEKGPTLQECIITLELRKPLLCVIAVSRFLRGGTFITPPELTSNWNRMWLLKPSCGQWGIFICEFELYTSSSSHICSFCFQWVEHVTQSPSWRLTVESSMHRSKFFVCIWLCSLPTFHFACLRRDVNWAWKWDEYGQLVASCALHTFDLCSGAFVLRSYGATSQRWVSTRKQPRQYNRI